MIIDLICDRMDGVPYVARDFYFDLLGYGGSADITAAMDGGTNKDVQRALCEYIEANDYRSEICDYINSKNWLNDDKNERLMEYEFRLMPTKRTIWTRKHHCETIKQAMTEARGMTYALYFQYKHPHVEIWQDGQMIVKIG